jgi:two-component system, sensor histidine kinase LadS
MNVAPSSYAARNHFLFLLFFFSVLSANAEDRRIVISQAFRSEVISRSCDVAEDMRRSWTIDTVSRNGFAGFAPVGVPKPSYGFTFSAFWVRGMMVNSSAKAQTVWLEIGYPSLDSIQFYEFDSTASQWQHRTLGDFQPSNLLTLSYRNPVIPIRLNGGEQKQFYMRIVTEGSVQFPLTLYSLEAFYNTVQLEQFLFGAYYGTMFIMVLYNLFLFFSIRDSNYLYYVGFISGTALGVAAAYGHGYQYLWGVSAWWTQRAVLIWMCVSAASAIVFSRSFLNLRLFAPRFDRMMVGVFYIILIIFTSAFFAPYALVIRCITVIIFICAIIAPTGALIVVRTGYRPAVFYTIAWLLFLTGACLATGKTLGLIPSTWLTNYGIEIGSVVEALLISFALGDRITILKRERAEAQENLLVQERRQKESLEHLVEVRTRELHQQNEELTALNIEKNELMGIVSHDLKNPIGAVRGYAELIENQILTGDEVLFASGKILQVSDRMLELVKNLLDMNQLESGGLQLNMVSFDISPVVEAVVYQYRISAEAKHIMLHFSNEAGESVISADEQALMQVLDNLVSNVVKYSPHGRRADVRVKRNADAVRVEVQDEGEGISPEDMKKLFGKFARLSAQPTGGEHSTGLGLSIVKRMVEAMNGRVWCESELGRGATFIVELPSAG